MDSYNLIEATNKFNEDLAEALKAGERLEALAKDNYYWGEPVHLELDDVDKILHMLEVIDVFGLGGFSEE